MFADFVFQQKCNMDPHQTDNHRKDILVFVSIIVCGSSSSYCMNRCNIDWLLFNRTTTEDSHKIKSGVIDFTASLSS